jgi:hypothetical protein
MALAIMSSGQVVVGVTPVPTTDNGMAQGTIAGPGCIVVIGSKGQVVSSFGPELGVNGPWGATVAEINGVADMCAPLLGY